MALIVRPARTNDADAVTHLLRRSITELCVADHHNDATALGDWLANKTPDQFHRWLANPDNYMVVAEENHQVLGVGTVRGNGYVSLLYRLPGAEGRGVGRAIFLALEQHVRASGLRELTTESTTTARGFYEGMGFKPVGDTAHAPKPERGWPYRKIL